MVLAFFVVTVAIMTASTTVLAAFGPTRVLRTAAPGVDLGVRNIAASRGSIAVGWRETHGGSYVEYVRWSTDGGQTFHPKVNLGEGSPHYYTPVDICRGTVLALTGPRDDLVLATMSLDGTVAGTRDLLPDPDGTRARGTNLACAGGRRFVAAWYDEITSPAHLKVAIQGLYEPLPAHLFDLGPACACFDIGLAATSRMIYVAWKKPASFDDPFGPGELRFKRFAISTNDQATITPLPRVTLLNGPALNNPIVAAWGSRVAFAYSQANDLKLAVSHDSGGGFGPPQTLVDEPDPGTRFVGTGSVDLNGRRILVQAIESDAGAPPLTEWGLFSSDDGATWDATPTHHGGIQVGALVRRSGIWRAAEAWDKSYSSVPRERLRFHTGTP